MLLLADLSSLLPDKLTLEQLGWAGLIYASLQWIIRIGFGIRIATKPAQAPISLSWLGFILAFPFVGAFFYLLMVENPLGRKRSRAHRLLTERLRPVLIQRWANRGLSVRDRDLESVTGPSFRSLAEFSTRAGGLPLLRDNHLELISDTEELLRRLAADIDAAGSHCHLLYYIWMRGGNAEVVADALIRAAHRGVDCLVLLDDVGSGKFFKTVTYTRMKAAGVRIVRGLPVNPLRARMHRVDLRNHRKIAVIDGLIAYAGSQNLTDITFHYKRRKHIGPWLDASVRIRGPAVQALALTFLSDWALEDETNARSKEWQRKVDTVSDRFFPEPGGALGQEPSLMHQAAEQSPSQPQPPTSPITPAGSFVQVTPTGPKLRGRASGASVTDTPTMRESLLTAIYAADHEIIISTPYFVPDDATLIALTSASRRGVNVTIIVTRKSDSRFVAAAGRSHYQELLDAGVRIAEFKKGVLHAKTFSADGKISMIGSANIDMRSFELNFEVTLFVYDPTFAGQLRSLQHEYIRDSAFLNAAEWRQRSWFARTVENFARLFGPLL
jgi:cardiolipin synthase A/B